MRLALAQHHSDGQPYSVATEVDLGAEPAPRTAEGVTLNPPFSPAAQRCARTMVLSIICSMSRSPPLSASACRMTSHTPERHQRRYCRQTEFQLPNWSGRSRHGAPVRQTQSAPSNTRRWFSGGRPPRDEGVVRKGATRPHSLSVNRPRGSLPTSQNREVGLGSRRSASGKSLRSGKKQGEARNLRPDSFRDLRPKLGILLLPARFPDQTAAEHRWDRSGLSTGPSAARASA